MSTFKPLPSRILLHIAQELAVSTHSLAAVIALLDEGGTVPFIARYRKEATGNLDEVQIRAIEEKLSYFRELESRRETVLASIAEQGKLTEELKEKIEAVLNRSELEDLYLPYKPKRRTKATIAREKGLEPLAKYLWNQETGPQTLSEMTPAFVNEELGVASVEEALEGARHIVAEWISESADLRKALRRVMLEEGIVVSRKALDAKDEQEKFKMYYEYQEPAKTIPSHRMLAIRRGESEGVLYFLIEVEAARVMALTRAHVMRQPGDWTAQLDLAIEDAWQRLLNSSIQAEIRFELKQRSDAEAIQVFRDNLYHLLLAPPAGPISVLGIDPGLRTGCKMAVVDETGKLLAHDVIYPHTSKHGIAEAQQKVEALIRQHQVRAIAIGNGTASRETDAFVREFMREKKIQEIFSVTVSEAGASVYSASDVARQEFPDLDLTVRGAISIARRLQDPLSELVKVDPKSIGVGQYQHDVDQRQLHESLENVIESCVNRVGVDLNTSSWTLLRYVAGVTERTAVNIVNYRNENGRFRSRTQLLEVSGVGPKTFEQAAGFLRIRDGENPLDMTAVHPESYGVVEQIAQSLSVTVPEIIRTPQLLERVDRSQLSAGAFTVNDILDELRKPGRDPRDRFAAPSFLEGVKEITDLKEGMVLEGVVTNVTKFGAFVDVGVHQDGLVHISELSNRFIKEPSEAVKAGQIVRVKVLSADAKTKRIALSMRALMEPIGRAPSKAKPVPKPTLSMDQKLAALSSKWKVR
ncbi:MULTISPECIES: Tex family protein [Acidobacterium]|uniref:S1 RNA binding domain protein n=1 Tax=Acidobacterium capsulatum (strain ATCC 51196 / DSM 11244 / BCRC 80197 / JCM 7670 / NBRC 15755 / NCIMB 13165 / 161) TaxID=240015 RepID=C1F2W2_ACIC5|nr:MULTISPECIES: Tex family protein [Acidobacterium]ACO33467.1 S1 RNA binding domain protein [Acidobacterium capsulatum ATCC 51196]HCT60105.1 RNA-binding transcriptional accessory protein [Acidobacterium sp.]